MSSLAAILGQVEIVQAAFACDFRDRDIAEVGQSRNDRRRLVPDDVGLEGRLVARVQVERHNRVEAVSGRDLGGRPAACVGDLHAVVAAAGEES